MARAPTVTLVRQSVSQEPLDILLIGAAPLPQGSSARDANRLKHLASVQTDLKRMLDFCADKQFVYENRSPFGKRSHVNAIQTLVNHADVMPSPPQRQDWLYDTIYKPTIYTSLRQVRENVSEFLAEASADNMMIYFSGHGTSSSSAAASPREEALLVPVSHRGYQDHAAPRVEAYTKSDLTNDIDRHLPAGKRLYIVVDADHGENAINLWQLKEPSSQRQDVILFAAANREINADYNESGGAFTRTFVEQGRRHVGQPLWKFAQAIQDKLPFDPNTAKPRSPAFLCSFPNLYKHNFLTTAAR